MIIWQKNKSINDAITFERANNETESDSALHAGGSFHPLRGGQSSGSTVKQEHPSSRPRWQRGSLWWLVPPPPAHRTEHRDPGLMIDSVQVSSCRTASESSDLLCCLEFFLFKKRKRKTRAASSSPYWCNLTLVRKRINVCVKLLQCSKTRGRMWRQRLDLTRLAAAAVDTCSHPPQITSKTSPESDLYSLYRRGSCCFLLRPLKHVTSSDQTAMWQANIAKWEWVSSSQAISAFGSFCTHI